MQHRYTTVTVAAVWVLTACVIGVMTGASSFGAVVLLVAFGLVPPALLLRGSREPSQTLSESIREALR